MIDEEIGQIAQRIANSKKYRAMQIPRETILDLLQIEFAKHSKKAEAIKTAKAKLHNITAVYLDKLDYSKADQALKSALTNKSGKSIAAVCLQFLQSHHSTNERIPYMDSFYAYIMKKIGNTCSILDLACGLNPFVIPLVGFPSSISYFAYDIHAPRIELIKTLFVSIDINGSAEVRDILIQPPQQKATAAFLFKEAHRLEKRRNGASRDLIRSLNVDYLFLSLPNQSLQGKYDLRGRMRRIVADSILGSGSIIDLVDFPSETLFYIGMNNGKA